VETAALYSPIVLNSMVPADKTDAMCQFLGGVSAQAATSAAHTCAICMSFTLTVDRHR
jgi:hypothetical protein